MGNNKKPKIHRTRLFVDLPTPIYKALEIAARQNFKSKASFVTEAIIYQIELDGIKIDSEQLVNKD
jgi:hypothetical protein